jgi:hypothetical protein
MEPQTCPFCHFSVNDTFYFCPSCGKKIKDPPASTSVSKQISIYLISILLPPLGLWPGVSYLLDKNEKAKMIGLVAIVLTIVSTILTTWYAYGLYTQLTHTLNSQLQTQTLGL